MKTSLSAAGIVFLICMSLNISVLAQEEPAEEETARDLEETETPAEPQGKTESAAVKENEIYDDLSAWDIPQLTKPKEFPYIEHHGYLRFRSDLFFRAHLGTQLRKQGSQTIFTSGFKPPLTENDANNNATTVNLNAVGEQGEDTLASANIRFRYIPTIHVAQGLKISAQFDILDNIVLGSTPDYNINRPDTPLVIFSQSQEPPSSGKNSFKDSIAVKQLFGEWEIFHNEDTGTSAGSLKFGRQAADWGLGILHNGGQCIDCDYGDYFDRVEFTTKLWGVYLSAAWDFVFEGFTSESYIQPFGQARDLEQGDDADQFVFSLFSKPIILRENTERRDFLIKTKKPVLDWGIYAVYRKQRLDVNSASYGEWLSGAIDFYGEWDKMKLVKRDAWYFIPDVWLKFNYWPEFKKRLRIELEGLFLYGEIGSIKSGLQVEEVLPDFKADIRQYGLAFEAEYMSYGLTVGLDAGFASGDEEEYFGFLDMKNFPYYGSTPVPNKKLKNLKFDPNYTIDLLLFREVIGTITNAIYFKPYLSYNLFDSEDDFFGFRFDIEYARALEPSATPGDNPHLGLETDLRVIYEEKNRFSTMLEWGMLWPGGAFDLTKDFSGSDVSKAARFASTLQARINILF